MGAAHKGRNDVIQLLVDRGAKIDARDKGSRDTANAASAIAGHQVPGARLFRGSRPRRRAVGDSAPGDRRIHSQAAGGSRTAGTAERIASSTRFASSRSVSRFLSTRSSAAPNDPRWLGLFRRPCHESPPVAGCVGLLLLWTTAFSRGAGSDVADAVMKGDTAAVRKLLIAKADVNATQVDGATALHWAVYRDDRRNGGPALARRRQGQGDQSRRAPRRSSWRRCTATPTMIEQLLRAGADPKERGPNGETMVMLAARNGNPAAIKMLVAAGADVNAKESLRATTRADVGGGAGARGGCQGRSSSSARTSARSRALPAVPEITCPRRSPSRRSKRRPSDAATPGLRAEPTRSS